MVLDSLKKLDPDNLLGGYSISFDLVSREYGWTDDQILDLTVRRFRQIVAAINRRHFMEKRDRISLTSWQTRTLATFIAAGYMTDGNNPAIDLAQNTSFDDIEKAQIEDAKKAEAEKPLPSTEPAVGSYEKFMSTFGSPKRWAGGS